MARAPEKNHYEYRGIRVAIVCLLAQMYLSLPLWWNTGREYPEAPLLPFAGIPFLDAAALLALLAGLALALWRPWNRYGAASALAALIFLVCLDLNRFQPWVYFYALLLGLNLLAPANTLRHVIPVVLAAVYFWSGLQKISPYFAEENFPWFCEAFLWTRPLAVFPELGYAAAAVEMCFGIFLPWQRSRQVIAGLILPFHLFIIAVLSPLGLGWNTLVIPWNLCMVALVWLGVRMPRKLTLTNPGIGAWLLIAAVWLLPVLAYFSPGFEPVAWKLYSNTQREVVLSLPNAPPCTALHTIWRTKSFNEQTMLLLDDWAVQSLGAPAYKGPIGLEAVGQSLCGCADTLEQQAKLIVLDVVPWDRSQETLDTLYCTDFK